MRVQENLSQPYYIRDLFQDGTGVAAPESGEGRILSLVGAIPGDRIAVYESDLSSGKKAFSPDEYQLLNPSPERQGAFCPHFPACGSCAVEEMGYGAFADLKRAQLEHLFGRAVPLRTGPAFRYRHKVFWHFSQGRFGYLGRGSGEVQRIESCELLASPLEVALEALNERAQEVEGLAQVAGLHLRCNQEGEMSFLLVLRAAPADRLMLDGRSEEVLLSTREAARALGEIYRAYLMVENCLLNTGYPVQLSGINFRAERIGGRQQRGVARAYVKGSSRDQEFSGENLGPVSILIEPEGLRLTTDALGRGPHPLTASDLEALSSRILTEEICGRAFRILPGAFFQVNPALFAETCRDIAEYLRGVKTVTEFFSGTGALGQASLAREVEVRVLELSQLSLLTAGQNAALNGFEHYSVRQYDLKSFQEEFEPVEAIIVDPPRAGLSQSFIRALARADFQKMVYLSCHPAALKRDLQRFEEAGLKMQVDAQYGYDYFPWTMHVETVCLMTRVR